VMVGGVDVTQYVSSSGISGSWGIGDTLTVNDPYIVVSTDTRVDIVYTGGGHGTYLLAVNGTASGATSGGPPVPAFTYSISGLTVTFTDLSTGGMRPLNYVWTFGDMGAGNTSTSPNPVHTYGSPGTYSVRLSVSNSTDALWVTSAPQTFTVYPPPPVASFSGSNTSGYAPLVVRFTDSSSSSPTNWSWTFGDMGAGNTSVLQSPLHTYLDTGTYTVSLTATNAGGSNTATYTNYITVIQAFTINATAGADGTITPAGITVVIYGDNSPTYTITNTTVGYHTADVLIDGVSNGTISSYQFMNVQANHTISASFAINTYNINVTAGSNGAITPGNTTVSYGGNSPVFTIANTTVGYHIADVLIDGVSNGTIPSYQFTNVQANHTISASFAINQYNINVTAGSNGAITPGNTTVNYGGNSPIFTITNTTVGYHTADVLIDGVSNGTIPSYQFTNVQANHTLSATFAINQYNINVTAGPHGSIFPGNTTVNHGGNSLTYSITPDPGYHIDNLTVDGSALGNVSPYQFTNVVANHTLSATFAINQFTITATSGPNGNVTPAGVTVVNYGAYQSYSITPITGYLVANVTVDGSPVGQVTTYNFTSVFSSHTIHATFAAVPVADFTASPLTGPFPLSVNFTDLSLNVPTSWVWNFGYNSTNMSISYLQNPTFVYETAGNYTVKLYATNEVGTNLSQKDGYILVYNPVVANFTGSPTSGTAILDVSFTDTSIGGPGSWFWEFGDTNTSSSQNPGNSYRVAGLYSVNLTVTNPYSSSYLFRANYINVTMPPPVARIRVNVTSGAAPLPIFFQDRSSGLPTSWFWDFADGNTSTSQHVNYTFNIPGSYNVSHTVTNAGGSSTAYQMIYVFAVPTVTSVAPPTGPVAGSTTVTILGTNLIGASAATFDGLSATGVSVINYTAVSAITPLHASAGLVNVNVTTPNGTATGTGVYTYVYPAPTVSSVVPAYGPVAGSTTVTILGTNLIGASAATFDGLSATGVSVINATAVTAITPLHASAGLVNVNVTTPNGTATGPNVYTYVALPTVTSVAPPTGPVAGGTSVTITGTNLIGATAVSIGGNTTTGFSVVSGTSITATTPLHAAGLVDVIVTTPNGTATGTNVYTYVALPTVTSVAPSVGPAAGGTSVTIIGTGLIGATGVTFGGTAGTGVSVVNSTAVTAITPLHALGTVNVNVTTPNGTSVTGDNKYTYVAAPTFVSIAPLIGPIAGGTPVTITGTNLIGATTSGIYNVSIGGTALTNMTVVSSTTIVGSTPAHAVGRVNVVITTPNGTATGTDAYRYYAIQVFTSSTSWAVPANVDNVEYLVVAGGGGGGRLGGGGGAGGVLSGTLTGLSGSQNVIIGGGGAGAASTTVTGSNGGNSSFANTTAGGGINAMGGGGGGTNVNSAIANGLLGGSGGGGAVRTNPGHTIGTVGSGITGQGNNGGAGIFSTRYYGGGGGGAGGTGGTLNGTTAGSGGIGSSAFSALLTEAGGYGQNVGGTRYIAGGGGGGAATGGTSGGPGGYGGGGTGALAAAAVNAGTVNTGGGGGASGATTVTAGSGGSGIVIIKYY